MIKILAKKSVNHENGMIHHSVIYRGHKNNKRIIALLERQYKTGKQSSLIKACYNNNTNNWIAENIRFFYDHSLYHNGCPLGFDELYNDAIKIGRLEYIASLEDIMFDKRFFDEVIHFPVNPVNYRSSLDLIGFKTNVNKDKHILH